MMNTILKADPKHHWATRLGEWLPGFIEKHPVLSGLDRLASVVLYGSTTAGVDDAFSDLDLWLLLTEADMVRLAAACETRFFGFELDGKAGHLTAHAVGEFREKVRGCEMDTICHLRNAVVLSDPTGAADELVRLACRPMRQAVSDAFFFYHYVEMRSEHRSCDNPMERNDPVASLLSLTKTIAHALRAAMVLDGEPYPYDKWLHRDALATPTGHLLGPSIERILGGLTGDGLRSEAPESDHPIGLELRVIRRLLIEAAQAKGNQAPWLHEWWLHMMQARQAIEGIRW